MCRHASRSTRRERDLYLLIPEKLRGTYGRHQRADLPRLASNMCRVGTRRQNRRSQGVPMTATEVLQGRSWVWGDDVNTDIIIPFRFKARTNDPVEMAKYCMYGFDPEFYKKVKKGDIFVAGKNFGGGSSREQAPVAIKYSGVAAVVAESFARIFYRNSFAIGLPALEVPGISKEIGQFDEVEVNLSDWSVTTKDGKVYHALKVTECHRGLMREGGLVEYYKKHKSFPWEGLQATASTT